MDTLILLRHAKAVRDIDAPDDLSRQLTARGQADAAEAGRKLQALTLEIGAVVVSPAARTRETADAVVPTLSPAPFVRVDDALYMAAPETLWAAAARTGASCVLVIAHNPGLQELVESLVRQSGDRSAAALKAAAHFPTAAFAAFSVNGDVAHAAGPRLIAAWTPSAA